MPLYIPHRCPKCFESVTVILGQHKDGALKGPAQGHCLNWRLFKIILATPRMI